MKTKKCFKCGKTKPIDDFYTHHRMKDGHLGKCKECTKKDMKLNRIKNGDYIRKYDIERGKNKKRKDHSSEHCKKWRKNNPEKYHANTILNNAVRDGEIIKPDYCEICGKICKPHGHHTDYSKPLDVVWLCPECHAQIQ